MINYISEAMYFLYIPGILISLCAAVIFSLSDNDKLSLFLYLLPRYLFITEFGFLMLAIIFYFLDK